MNDQSDTKHNESVAERVGNHVGLGASDLARAGLNLLPFGGAVASLWADRVGNLRNRRVDDAMRELQSAVESHGKVLDPSKMGEAEIDLFALIMEKVAREHRQKKRQRFVRLLASSLVNVSQSYDEREYFAKALGEFQDMHIAILRSLPEDAEDPIEFDDLVRKLFPLDPTDHDRFSALLPALENLSPAGFGFIRRHGSKGPGRKLLTSPFTPEWPATHACYSILPIGVRFLDSLGSDDK